MQIPILYSPAFYGHIMNGLLLLCGISMFYLNYTKINDKSTMMTIILLLSIAFGIHSLSHLGLEIKYNFNPLQIIAK